MRRQIIKYAMLSLVLLLAACGKEAEYANVVPADVEFVATFDCKQILNESGLLATERTESTNQLISTFTKNLSAGETDLFYQILANPSEIGVDWSQKVYAFGEGSSNEGVLVLPVIDTEKLKASFLTFAGSKIRGRKFVDEDGFFWASGRHFYLAINDKVCLVISNENGKQDALKQRVRVWLNQKREESFAATKYHDMLLDQDGEIAVFASMSVLPENMSMMASMAYSEDMDISSIKYLANVSLEKGQILADGKILYEDQNLEKWIKEQGDACKQLDAKSLAYLPKTTPLWFGVGLDGNDLYNRLLDHPTYGKQLRHMSLPLDIEGVMRSIDGDLAIAYPNGLFVDVKNDEILRICVGAITTMGRFIGLDLEETEKNQYKLKDENHRLSNWLKTDVQLSMGMNDDSFYLLTSASGTAKLPKEEALASASWAKEVDNNMLFIAFNFHNGSKLVDDYASSRKKSKVVKDYFDYLTYSQENIERNKIVLSLNDQERNVVEQLIELYFQLF